MDARAVGDGDGNVLAEQKRQARARAKEDRSRISIDHAQYCETLGVFLETEVAEHQFVVLYLAMSDEVDLAGLIAQHPNPARRFAVTRTPEKGLALTVHPWGEPQEHHPYGYSQPTPDSRQVADGDIGAVLVPGLAFDSDGARLGRGKGYYDRFLPRLDPACLRIGITGDYVPPVLPTGRYDVPMTHLAFADRVIAVRRPDQPAPRPRVQPDRQPRRP